MTGPSATSANHRESEGDRNRRHRTASQASRLTWSFGLRYREGLLGYPASQPAMYPRNYPHESVEVNGMRWLARVRTERPVRSSSMDVGEPDGTSGNAPELYGKWAGWSSHCCRSGLSRKGSADAHSVVRQPAMRHREIIPLAPRPPRAAIPRQCTVVGLDPSPSKQVSPARVNVRLVRNDQCRFRPHRASQRTKAEISPAASAAGPNA
jgi:hypothetical protein